MNTGLVLGYLVLGLPIGLYFAFVVFVASGISFWGAGTTTKIVLAFLIGSLFYPLILFWLGLEKCYKTIEG